MGPVGLSWRADRRLDAARSWAVTLDLAFVMGGPAARGTEVTGLTQRHASLAR